VIQPTAGWYARAAVARLSFAFLWPRPVFKLGGKIRASVGSHVRPGNHLGFGCIAHLDPGGFQSNGIPVSIANTEALFREIKLALKLSP